MLTKFSMKKPITIIVMIIIVAILGGIAYINMGVDLLPNMNLPYMVVVVASPGSSPDEIETEIILPTEQELSTLSGLKQMNTTAYEHFGVCILEFSGTADMTKVTIDIQSKMNSLKSSFSEMAMEPILMQIDPSMLPVMTVAISEEGKLINESSEYLSDICDQLVSVEGVGTIDSDGLVENLVLVMMDNDLLVASLEQNLVVDRELFYDEEAYQLALDAYDADPINVEEPDREDFFNEEDYNSAVDGLSSLAIYAASMIQNMLKPELVEMAIYGQNFNMPVGTVKTNGVDYLVKIGDGIYSEEELEETPIISMDFKKMIGQYDQILQILKGLEIDAQALKNLAELADETSEIHTALNGTAEDINNIVLRLNVSQENEDLLVQYNAGTINLTEFIDGLTLANEELEDPELNALIAQIEANGGIVEIDIEGLDLSALFDLEEIEGEVYIVFDRDIVEGLNDILTDDFVDELEDITIPLVATPQFILDIVEASDAFELNVSGTGYVVTDAVISMLRTGNRLIEDIDDFEYPLASIEGLAEGLAGLSDALVSIGEAATSIDNFLADSDLFEEVYILDETTGEPLLVEGSPIVEKYIIASTPLDALATLEPLSFTVKDIANVISLSDAGSQHSIVNGEPGVIISIQKQSSASTVEASKNIIAELEKIKAENPDFNYTVLSDQGDFISIMINNIIKNLAWGAIFAVIILFLFLKKLRPTLIVGSAIIISVVASFVLMYFSNITLNIISMGGLSLAVGMLVDNSIVVIENIYRRRALGDSVKDACIKGARQVSGAIFSSTLTTIVIFLPIVFVEGITQQIFIDIGYTITFSLLASLLVALTFVPICVKRVLDKDKVMEDGKYFNKIRDTYLKFLEFSLNKKWVVFTVVFILLAISIVGLLNMNRIFFPASDMGSFTVSVALDGDMLAQDGISYDDATSLVVAELDKKLRDIEEVEEVGIQVTSGVAMLGIDVGGQSITANVVLIDGKRATSKEILEDAIEKLNSDGFVGLDSKYISITGSSESMDMVGIGGNELYFKVYSDNLDDAKQIATELSEEFANVNGVDTAGISSGFDEPTLEYRLVLDKDIAINYGLYVGSTLQLMQTELASITSSTTIKYDSDNLKYELYVYGNEYDLERWYNTYDDTNALRKVYINYDDTYYIYDNNEKIDCTRISAGGELTNTFIYSTLSGEYDLYGDTGDMTINYSVDRESEIDITTYIVTSTVLADTDYEYIVSVPMYALLEDDCFTKDVYGNIEYRVAIDPATGEKLFEKDLEGNPREYMTDEFDNQILDNNMNPIPVYIYEKEGMYLRDSFGSYLLNDDGERIFSSNEISDSFTDADLALLANMEGAKIPQSIKLEEGYVAINREDGTRSATITVPLLSDADSGVVFAECEKVANNYMNGDSFPVGAVIEAQGESEMITEVYETLYLILAAGIVLIYLVMVAQFQSFKSPFIVMFTVPLAFTGSILAIILAGFSLSVVALVGLIVLMGIVVNNGIVFIDYVNQLIEEGMARREALMTTGRDRLRPILMTALTTIFALMVMALDSSPEGSMMKPMAVSTIGGLIYATLLTIVFVPMVYDIFNKKKGVVKEVESPTNLGLVASNEFVTYSAYEKYANEEAYDKKLLAKHIKKKGMTKQEYLDIYNEFKNKD